MLTYKARELVAQRKWVEASTAFSHAARLMPTSDLALIAHADMLRQALGQLPPGSGADRRTLYREALALLDDAEKANPLRSQLFFIRGLLYHQVPDLTGPDWADRAAHAYATALKRDPMAFWAREALWRSVVVARGNLSWPRMYWKAASTTVIRPALSWGITHCSHGHGGEPARSGAPRRWRKNQRNDGQASKTPDRVSP